MHSVHQSPVMTSRFHLWMRLGALALLVGVAAWPRSKPEGARASAALAARFEARGAKPVTTAAKLEYRPRTTKLVVASADDVPLTD